jgi:hypothetical protein
MLIREPIALAAAPPGVTAPTTCATEAAVLSKEPLLVLLALAADAVVVAGAALAWW